LMYDGLAMFVNDDLLAQAGKEVPTSWEDLRQTAIDLSVCDSEDGICRGGDKILISGASLGTTENIDHWQDILAVLMLQNNVNLNSPSGAAAEEALQFYTIFSRSDHMWDATLPTSTTAFAGGKVGIYFGPSWRVFDILAANPTLKFSVHPLPQLPLDPARGEKPIAWASFWAEGVNRKSAQTEAAWAFVKFLSTPASLQKMYQQASLSGRAFGEIYPRQDMAGSLVTAPYVSAYLLDAVNARSWYLASATFDGATGINSLLSKYFEDAVNGVNQGRAAAEAVRTLNSGVNQVLSRYGLATSAVAQ
jgi:ABC-type glycerol-3-phosphate transport system substrate-binding protein